MLKKAIINSVSNLSLTFLNIAFVFVMSPIVIKNLGNYDYGIWEILISVTGYMGLLEFGIPSAVVRFVAKYNALNNKEKLNQLYSSILLIMLIAGLFTSLCIMGWAIVYPEGLADNITSVQKYSIFLMIAAVNTFLIFPNIFIQSIHEGFQRYGLTKLITAIKMILTNGLIYYFLNKGYGLISFITITTAANFIKVFCLWMLLKLPRYGPFRFKMNDISKDTLKEMYAFGLKSFLLGISRRISFHSDSLVIGFFLNPALVVFYTIPVSLVDKLKGIGASLSLSFMPLFSELYATRESEKLNSYFFICSRYILGIMSLGFLGVFLGGLPFIEIWIGPEYRINGELVLYMMGAAFLLPFFNPMQVRIMESMGKHDILAKLRIGEAGLNLVLSVIFANFLNIEGVALGTLIPAVIVEPIIFYKVSQLLKIKKMTYFKQVIFPQFIPVLLTTTLFYFTTSYLPLKNYSHLLFVMIFCTVFHSVFFFLFIVTKNEKSIFIKNLIHIMKKK